jgi:hypothetical protein
MSDFLIAYDLVAGDEDEYPDLWNALQLLKAYPIQKSVWRLSGDYTRAAESQKRPGGRCKRSTRRHRHGRTNNLIRGPA